MAEENKEVLEEVTEEQVEQLTEEKVDNKIDESKTYKKILDNQLFQSGYN